MRRTYESARPFSAYGPALNSRGESYLWLPLAIIESHQQRLREHRWAAAAAIRTWGAFAGTSRSIRKSRGDIRQAMLDVLRDIKDHMLFLDGCKACGEELMARGLNAITRERF